MKTALQVWQMCLRLLLTSWLYWVIALVAMIGLGHVIPFPWACPLAVGGAGLAMLACALLVETRGGMWERIRVAQAQRHFMAGAFGALATLALAGAVAGFLLHRG